MPSSDHPFFAPENLYRAYRQCRRRKRNTCNALAFEQHCEEHILALHEELTSRRYRPAPYSAFLVTHPKQREIFAADFRDRVVHHLLVGHLEPAWERRFIHDSYACRTGKGTHKAVERLQSFLRKVTANGTRRAWYLQLDIRGYFVTLDRQILYERLNAHESDPAAQWLIRVILFTDPTEQCRFRDTCRADHERLPPHKTLFHASPGCGLPIGNLTSQFFANVYLDALDQFVKHTLKARHYLRYCDDLVLLSAEKPQLEAWEQQIAEFLNDRLHLHLNERRKLRPVSDGIDFLGYIVRADYLLVRRRVVGALRDRLDRAEHELRRRGMTDDPNSRRVFPWHWPLIEQIRQWLASYLGHLRHASAHGLIQRLRTRFDWLDEYLVWEQGKIVLRCPIPRHAIRYRQQVVWFKGHLPGHILMIQLGQWWEMRMARDHLMRLRDCSPDMPLLHSLTEDCPIRRFPERRIAELRPVLWDSGVPVAWIRETGRRLGPIAERAVTYRWSGGTPVFLQETKNECTRMQHEVS